MGSSESKSHRNVEQRYSLPPVEDRRLGDFSKLLEVGSGAVCVAVAIIDGEFIIAENSLYRGSKGAGGTATQSSVERKLGKIYGYFSAIAQSNVLPVEKDRKEFFTSIAAGVKPGTADSPFHTVLGPEVSDELIKSIVENTKPSGIKRRPRRAAAYAEWKNIYDIIGQLEQSILTASTRDSEVQRAKFIGYHAALKKPPVILKAQSKSGVHAELQILDYKLVSSVMKRITQKSGFDPELAYVAVSKLCCEKCFDFIVTVNAILVQQGANCKFDVRGRHEVKSAAKNWVLPDILAEHPRFRELYLSFIQEEFQRELEALDASLKLDDVLGMLASSSSPLGDRGLKKRKKTRGDASASVDVEREKKKSDIVKRYCALIEEMNGKTNSEYISRPALDISGFGYQLKKTEQYPSPSNSLMSRDEQSVVSIFLNDLDGIPEAGWSESKLSILRKFEVSLELMKIDYFRLIFASSTVEVDQLASVLDVLVRELNARGLDTSSAEVLAIMQDSRFVGEPLARFFVETGPPVSSTTDSPAPTPDTLNSAPGPSRSFL